MSLNEAAIRQQAAMIRAVAYVRMSTEKQVYSTANQMDAIEKYAASKNIEVPLCQNSCRLQQLEF
nr:recombinase family protein [uncultured Janthinobacterium sp.]